MVLVQIWPFFQLLFFRKYKPGKCLSSCQQGSYNYNVRHVPARIPHQTTTFQPTYTSRDKPRCQDSGDEPYYVNHNETKVGVILNQPKEVLKLGGLNSVAANSFKQTSFQIPNVPPDCRNLLKS